MVNHRLLCLYISTDIPSEEFQILVEYIVKIYAPLWFVIKISPPCDRRCETSLANYFVFTISPDYLKQIKDLVIQHNGYFCRPENILLGMITDNRKHIRDQGLRRIWRARSERKTSGSSKILHSNI